MPPSDLSWLLALIIIVSAALALAALVLTAPSLRRRPQAELIATWKIIVPRGATFPTRSAAAWFEALSHRLHRGQVAIVEWRGVGRNLELRLAVPAGWERSLRGQLSAWFPGARLERQVRERPLRTMAVVPLRLQEPAIIPLLASDEQVPDPLLALIGSLVDTPDTCGVRITWGAAHEGWHHWAVRAAAAIRRGAPIPRRGFGLARSRLLEELLLPKAQHVQPVLAPRVLEAVSRKAQDRLFSVQVYAFANGPSWSEAADRVALLAAHLHSLSGEQGANRLVPARGRRGGVFSKFSVTAPELVLGAPELALLFHLPESSHPLIPTETSRQVSTAAETLAQGEQPGPSAEQTYLGEALTDAGPVPLQLGPAERRLHTYLIGKTGTGKSTVLATLARQDLAAGRGVALIDPHGDLAEQVLALVPPSREDDVLYFNAADTDWPISFNLLHVDTAAQRPLVASGVVGVFKKLYGESWGPRLEYFLRNAVLTLLETPEPSLLLLPRLLTDTPYRMRVLTHVRDPLLRTFFLEEYAHYDPRWRAEAISPILNKVGQFLSSPVVRHIVGQGRPGFQLRQVMDRGQIFIANLASGKIGEDNCDLLGGLLVAGFQLAAMSRAALAEPDRRDFALLVDEFQHFANDAFATILSEARKYGLSLTLSHQYLDQVPPPILDAVLGNVGTLLAFRVGATDTARLARELSPAFDAQDLVHLPNYHFCARLARLSGNQPPFTARTLPLPPTSARGHSLISRSRHQYGRPRAEVELEIADIWEGRADL